MKQLILLSVLVLGGCAVGQTKEGDDLIGVRVGETDQEVAQGIGNAVGGLVGGPVGAQIGGGIAALVAGTLLGDRNRAAKAEREKREAADAAWDEATKVERERNGAS